MKNSRKETRNETCWKSRSDKLQLLICKMLAGFTSTNIHQSPCQKNFFSTRVILLTEGKPSFLKEWLNFFYLTWRPSLMFIAEKIVCNMSFNQKFSICLGMPNWQHSKAGYIWCSLSSFLPEKKELAWEEREGCTNRGGL